MQDNNRLKIDITRTSHPPINDFRVSTIRSDFDYNIPEITEHFQGEIIIPDKWNIGVIVGSSGSGKTTIAKQLFGNCFVQLPGKRNPSVVMDMPEGHSVSDITKMFTSLGFSSVPSWLKPYGVLSNGEKMRADLAYTLLSADSSPWLLTSSRAWWIGTLPKTFASHYIKDCTDSVENSSRLHVTGIYLIGYSRIGSMTLINARC